MRRVYPIDVFPGAWKQLDTLAKSRIAASTEMVLKELESQDDEVWSFGLPVGRGSNADSIGSWPVIVSLIAASGESSPLPFGA